MQADYSMPQCLCGIKEINACYEISRLMLLKYLQDIENMYLNIHIETATEEGLSHKERMYNIIPGKTDSFDERKFRIEFKEYDYQVHNEENFADMLRKICGDSVSYSVDMAQQKVFIICDLTSVKVVDMFEKLAREFLPINMDVDIITGFNKRSDYSDRKYWDLRDKTYNQVKVRLL